jgi:signal transduction histidine kinase
LARAERSAQRCDAIIDELLTFSRNKQPRPERVQLRSWLCDVVAEYEVPGGFKLECDPRDDASAYVDPEDLRRCLINLLSNAAHAISAAQRSPADGVIRLGLERATHAVALWVEDNGTGMSSDVHARLFEPLFSTKGFGVGLGLCIVRDLIGKNGGSIEFSGLAAGGTRATLTMPAALELPKVAGGSA